MSIYLYRVPAQHICLLYLKDVGAELTNDVGVFCVPGSLPDARQMPQNPVMRPHFMYALYV